MWSCPGVRETCIPQFFAMDPTQNSSRMVSSPSHCSEKQVEARNGLVMHVLLPLILSSAHANIVIDRDTCSGEELSSLFDDFVGSVERTLGKASGTFQKTITRIFYASPGSTSCKSFTKGTSISLKGRHLARVLPNGELDISLADSVSFLICTNFTDKLRKAKGCTDTRRVYDEGYWAQLLYSNATKEVFADIMLPGCIGPPFPRRALDEDVQRLFINYLRLWFFAWPSANKAIVVPVSSQRKVLKPRKGFKPYVDDLADCASYGMLDSSKPILVYNFYEQPRKYRGVISASTIYCL